MSSEMVKDYSKDFQTPPPVAEYMATLLYSNVKPKYGRLILEPTPGEGNLVKALKDRGYDIYRPKDYFLRNKDYDDEFDAVVMNPPFNAKYAILDHAPENYGGGMRFGYKMLTECMEMAPIVIALMPWFTISDSDIRLRALKKYGLKSLTALPRKTFQYARIQTVVIELVKDYKADTKFHMFEF